MCSQRPAPAATFADRPSSADRVRRSGLGGARCPSPLAERIGNESVGKQRNIPLGLFTESVPNRTVRRQTYCPVCLVCPVCKIELERSRALLYSAHDVACSTWPKCSSPSRRPTGPAKASPDRRPPRVQRKPLDDSRPTCDAARHGRGVAYDRRAASSKASDDRSATGLGVTRGLRHGCHRQGRSDRFSGDQLSGFARSARRRTGRGARVPPRILLLRTGSRHLRARHQPDTDCLSHSIAPRC